MPFAVGNKYGHGRPRKSKNVLPIIREKILNKLHQRINELDNVQVEELLAFARAIMPKDINVAVAPTITYISNCPRPVDIDVVSTDATVTHDAMNAALPDATTCVANSTVLSKTLEECDTVPPTP